MLLSKQSSSRNWRRMVRNVALVFRFGAIETRRVSKGNWRRGASTKRYLNAAFAARNVSQSYSRRKNSSPRLPRLRAFSRLPFSVFARSRWIRAHKEEDPPSVLSIPRSCICSAGRAMLFADKSLFSAHLAFARGGVDVGGYAVQFNAI